MSRAGIAIVLACTNIVATNTVTFADGPPLQRRVTTDAYAYTPPPEQLFYNWSGAYVGGHLGVAWGETQGTMTTLGTEGVVERTSGLIGGAQGGYMHQFSSLVLGAEIKYSWADATFITPSLAWPGVTLTTRVNDIFMVTGRLGYAYMNWLAYWKGGWATARTEHAASGVFTGASSTRGNGWVTGAGLSYAFGPNIIGGVEYDYVHLNVEPTTPVNGAVRLSSSGIDVQSVTLRLDFKFGH